LRILFPIGDEAMKYLSAGLLLMAWAVSSSAYIALPNDDK
jgi:hypothetical protein